MTIDIICPLYNASKYILDLNKSLIMQKKVKINKIIYVLTSSNDDTELVMKNNNISFKKIPKDKFSHSLTREEEGLNSNADLICFISQDIIIESDMWLYNLSKTVISGKADAAYSRQIGKYNNIEKYTREYNYKEESIIKDKSKIKELGLNTFFFSDASSIIKTSVFKELNGYDHKDLPINEDMYFAYKLIMNDKKIEYAATSVIYHSHNFTLKELYKRYKLTGEFFKENSYLNDYSVNNSGKNLALYVLKRIISDHKIKLLFRFPFDMASRLIGMKRGAF